MGKPIVSDEVVSKTETSAKELQDDTANKTQSINYLTLVNKLNSVPDGWENSLETVTITNSLGDDVEVEKKAYDAYVELKAELEKDGINVDLASARRSVEEQQGVMDKFIKTYGAEYATKTVAAPGYSEHHTGLALDLYLNIDGEDVYSKKDMVKYTEIWEKIHKKISEYGFILRYLEDKEYITGYGYEPWHLRYIDDVKIAQEITAKGLTLEEYLGVVNSSDVNVDLGTSEMYTEEELKEAAIQVKCKFATFKGCELQSVRYIGDGSNTQDNIRWLNSLNEGAEYIKVAEFITDFHTPKEGSESFSADQDVRAYPWWLAQNKDGGWHLVKWGYY